MWGFCLAKGMNTCLNMSVCGWRRRWWQLAPKGKSKWLLRLNAPAGSLGPTNSWRERPRVESLHALMVFTARWPTKRKIDLSKRNNTWLRSVTFACMGTAARIIMNPVNMMNASLTSRKKSASMGINAANSVILITEQSIITRASGICSYLAVKALLAESVRTSCTARSTTMRSWNMSWMRMACSCRSYLSNKWKTNIIQPSYSWKSRVLFLLILAPLNLNLQIFPHQLFPLMLPGVASGPPAAWRARCSKKPAR